MSIEEDVASLQTSVAALQTALEDHGKRIVDLEAAVTADIPAALAAIRKEDKRISDFADTISTSLATTTKSLQDALGKNYTETLGATAANIVKDYSAKLKTASDVLDALNARVKTLEDAKPSGGGLLPDWLGKGLAGVAEFILGLLTGAWLVDWLKGFGGEEQ